MNEIFRYLLQASVAITLFYGIYLLLLRREPLFRFNRIYLVLVTLFSVFFPLMPLGTAAPVLSRIITITLDPVYITAAAGAGSSLPEWETILFSLYLSGAGLLTLRLVYRLLQISLLISRHGIVREYRSRVVQLPGNTAPFSFFNLIFLPRKASGDSSLQAILLHETIHVRQWHTLDVLLTELLTILLWFNPVVWFLRQSVRTLHEYLADEGVLTSGMKSNLYQQLILDQTLGIPLNSITHQFNVSLLKNRIAMMTKQTSAKMAWSKALLAIPTTLFVVIFLLAASQKPLRAQDQSTLKDQQYKEQQQKEQQLKEQQMKEKQLKEYQAQNSGEDPIYEKVDKAPEYPGGQQAMYAYIGKNVQYPVKALDKKVNGTVMVSFIIEKDGSVSHIKALKGIGSGCDEEAIRVVKEMPKWKPGEVNGKPVRVNMVLPIKFKLS